ncbi:MAG: hypothetical protein IJN25_08660 [Clostridia bacterium]|nr:hypothetical protein [Clostridia bacterium]
MKTAKKILSTILAGALMAGMAMMPASADVIYAQPADLFAEGFESKEISTTGDGVVNTMARNGEKSYVITEDGTEPKLEIPIGNAAEAWVDKMLVAEAWYHIEGELAGYDEREVPGETEGTTTMVPYGEQVTMAFYKDAETVSSFLGVVKTKYSFENAVWPNKNTEGWYRIRATGIIKNAEDLDLSDSKIVIGITGAKDGVKLYVDDVRVFETDNIVEMKTKGNADFDTYDATCISGWEYWNCNGDGNNYGKVEYSKEHKTSGEYSVKYTKNGGTTTGQHGIMVNDVRLADFGATPGSTVIIMINTVAEHNSSNFVSTQFSVTHDSFPSVPASAYAVEGYKTTVSRASVVPQNNANTVRIRRNDNSTATDNYIYFDDICIKVIPEKGFSGFKENKNGNVNGERCVFVDVLSHGSTVYPYSYFVTEQEEKVTHIIARYVNVAGEKRLDDIRIESFDSYGACSFDKNQSIQTSAITVPATGEYTYKIMTWGEIGGLTSLLDTTTYEVK